MITIQSDILKHEESAEKLTNFMSHCGYWALTPYYETTETGSIEFEYEDSNKKVRFNPDAILIADPVDGDHNEDESLVGFLLQDPPRLQFKRFLASLTPEAEFLFEFTGDKNEHAFYNGKTHKKLNLKIKTSNRTITTTKL